MIQISEHFTIKKLLQYTFPSMTMLVFTSIYGVVDGFFVSNYVGKTSFTAVNFIMPFLMILGSVGFMFGTGGGALIAKMIGEGKREEGNKVFTMVVAVSIVCGAVLTVAGFFSVRSIANLLGARGEMLENSVLYAKIILCTMPAFILQYEFQCLCATAEKPRLGLYVTVAAGLTNIILDALFVAVFHYGLVGAAIATALSQLVGGVIPLIYFACPNSSLLRFTRFSFDGKSLAKTCVNGSSELMSNISMSLVGMLYNFQLLNYAGENGVAAYGVLMYVNLVFQALFIGFSVGGAPIISYHYGAGNRSELKGILKRALIVISVLAVFMFALSELLSGTLSNIFVGYDKELYDMTCRAFFIYSFSFLFSGFAIYGSSFFTALNDGLVSALISFMRTAVFQVVAVLSFPLLLGIDGIWLSIVAAEFMAVAVTVFMLVLKRKKYGY